MSRRFYFEDSRWPWRPDPTLPRFVKKVPPQRHRELSEKHGALDVGMGYGRNALWLAERGYEVEGWEKDRRYVAEARREARRRGVSLVCRRGDFTRAKLAGPYEVIVASCALHMMPRSKCLRVLARLRRTLAPGGRLFLLVKLTTDSRFRAFQRSPEWAPVRGERNTLRKRRGAFLPRGRGGIRPGPLQSRLTPGELWRALRGLRLRHYREVVLRSEWSVGVVTHGVAEVVAERPRMG